MSNKPKNTVSSDGYYFVKDGVRFDLLDKEVDVTLSFKGAGAQQRTTYRHSSTSGDIKLYMDIEIITTGRDWQEADANLHKRILKLIGGN